MAGKIQLAAKCLLGTTLLASGTGGVYYASSHGYFLPGHEQQAKESAASDLDAVAGAWSETPSSHADTSQSSPVARSANEGQTSAEKAIPKSLDADRYAAPAETPTPAKDVVKKDSAKTTASQKPKVDPDAAKSGVPSPVTVASHKDVKKSNEPPSPTPDPAVADASVARGQEPKDDAPQAVSVKNPSSDIGGALNAVATNGGLAKQPKPLAAPDKEQTNSVDAAQRAKQAFGNASASTAIDRYNDSAPPAPGSVGATKAVTVNPFGSAPIAVPSTNSKNGLIEPLRSSANDVDAPLGDAKQNGGGLRPLETSRAARDAYRDTMPKNPGPRAVPAAQSPNPYANTLPRSGVPGGDAGLGSPSGADGTGKPGEKALEGPQQPTLVIQKFAPGEVQVGKPAKFVLQVRNAGAQAADNVTVQDEIPQGTQLISTSPNATNDGSRLVWTLGKLSAGEDRTVEMQVMPKSEGDIGSVATVSYTAQASVRTHCTMPQLAIRMTAPSEVMIGQQQHVKIEIRNPGSGDATKVMLFENVPPNVKHVAGPALEFEIGTLHPNETRELDLVLTAEKAGKVTNTLTARSEGNLQVQQQVEFEVIAPALSVAVQGPERRYLERPATYEVSVQNPGTAPAHDVQIVTKLPKGLRFIKANNMGEYDAASHAVYWSLAELPKGERGTVELVAMPIETGTQTLQVESRAQQGLADKTQRDVVVEGLAAIKFEVKTMEDPIEVGGETGYEIRVVNQGTKAATNVQITAELPPGLKLVSAEGETQHKADQGHLTFEPLQQLAPKADTVYKIRAQGIQAGDQRIVVEVKTDDLQQPIRREESTRVFGDQ